MKVGLHELKHEVDVMVVLGLQHVLQSAHVRTQAQGGDLESGHLGS